MPCSDLAGVNGMSLRDLIRQTKMLIEHGLYVTRGTANGGVYERPLEAARLEERILFSASAISPVAAELAEAGETLTSALVSMGDDATIPSDNGALSDQQFLDLIADTILPPQSSYSGTTPRTTSDAPSANDAPTTDDAPATDDPATNTAATNDLNSDQQQRTELVFVDTGVADYEAIVNDIRTVSRSTRAVQIVLLDATQDGLKQINLHMSGMTERVDTVHFITHGTDRALKLGSTWIDVGSLASHQSDLEQWRNVLTPDADLVFYGCDLASGESGRSILNSIALWTDADIAASDDATGMQSLGGDWDLEYNIGEVNSQIIVSGELQREWRGLLATFTVTNTNDSGAGSLRQAIINANSLAGTDTISFSIGSGLQTITLSTILPAITETAIIDGTTQNGFSGTPLIIVNGNNAILDGLRLYTGSDNSTIRGFVIQGFTQDAIDITSSGNTIQGNYIGTNAAGTVAVGNSNGLNIWSGDNNIIGGTTAADGNIISGNTNVGMIISGGANNTQVYGNYIGLNAAGTAALGNTYHGIVIDSSIGTILGGITAGHRNVISANGGLGVSLDDADNSVIYGNYIGTNAAGTVDVNGTSWNSSQTGIYINNGSSGNVVGSTTAGARNIISGNNHYGVEILGASSINNTVSGNYIGTDVTGLNAVGNSGGGVSFWGAGTGNAYRDNVISGNLNVGVLVSNASSAATIQGNLIGLGADGVTVLGNWDAGIYVLGDSQGTLIGTDVDGNGDAAEGNTISGNTHGIIVSGAGTSGTLIQGNLIGLNAAGTGAIANDFDGIHISLGAHHNTIGGTAAGAGNVVSGNGAAGIQVEGAGSDFNTIQGNFIGTDITGLVGLGNGDSGIKLANFAVSNLVGGTDANAGNVIADNGQNGIEVNSSFSNTIQGNLIGIGADEITILGNSYHGIDLNSGSSSNLIGGVDEDAGNTIVNNGLDGVSVDSSGGSGNSILGNSIWLSGARGIDLIDNGVTLNDAGDGDTGPNELQNFPVLTSVYSAGGDTRFQGTLNSIVSTTFRIEFFASEFADPTGYGEGEVFLGAVSVTTDGSGNATFDHVLTGVSLTPGYLASATATEDFGGGSYGNTSEFAANVIVIGNEDPVLVNGGTAFLSEGGTSSPFFGIGTVTDPDSPDFDGGILAASITSGIQSGDTLLLTNAGGVSVSGTDVLVGGIMVGTVFGGADGVPLTVTFNADATLVRVQSVYQAIALHSSVDNPVLGIRVISAIVTDGDGGTSNPATGNVDFNSAVNDTPMVTPSAPLTVLEDTSAVLSLLVTDPDANGNSLKVSLSLDNGSGTISLGSTTGLTFSVGDGSLDATMSFTGTLVDLNNALASITYAPTNGFNGSDTLQYTIDDQGNTGSGGAQEATGAILITVDSENDAPLLSGANNFTAIDEDSVFNSGTLVSDLIAGRVTDPDPGASFGIAVTSVNNADGDWQYTIDNGSNWLSFGSVSTSAARLLTGDVSTRVRFVPNSNYNGTVSGGVAFVAWDGTTGVAGSTANIAAITYLEQFSATSYSNDDGTGLWSGSWVETDNGGGGSSGGFFHVNSGTLEIQSDRLNDNVYRQVDLSAANLAVLSLSYQNSISGGDGDAVSLQISSNGGGSYSDLAVFSSSSYSGSGSLSFDITSHASSNTRIRMIVTSVDQTRSVDFDNIQISSSTSSGGTTAFSTITASSSLVVNSVNDEQIFVPGPGQSFAEGSGGNIVTTETLLTTDADNAIAQLVYTLGILPTHGVLKLNGVVLGVSDTFTQAQVNAGQLTYDHDGTEHSTESFSFSVDDGVGADTGVLVNFQINAVNDNSPLIVSNGAGSTAGVSVSENSTAVTTVQATDADLPAEMITYSIVSDLDSLDAAAFAIDSVSGVLTFLAAPNFETPTDSDGNNIYVVKVQATDGTMTDTQLISVSVTDVLSIFEVTTVSDVDDSGLGASYTIEQLHAAGGGADGKISLREAIIAANTTAGLDTITFNIAGVGPHTISLTTALPEITQAIIIDGWSEPDFSGTPVIQLDGTASPVGADGLWISSGGSTVRGLIISGFDDRGISLTGGGGNTIVGNWIGVSADGTTASGNGTGIYVSSANNIIGGTTAAERNVVSGNNAANMTISGATASSNLVTGNYFGTSADGLSAIISFGNGINISHGASGNVIGGSSQGAGNVVAGSTNIGIEIFTGANGNSIIGNLLGVNATGTAVLSSSGVGVTINNVNNAMIGGTAAGEGNTFGGFATTALWVLGNSSNVNVQGNYFGTDSSETATFTIGSAIDIWCATNSTIGGTASGSGNIVRNTTGVGISVLAPSTNISILGNAIQNTTGPGIDLNGDGVTANDADDSDIGANQLTNFPVITMAARSGATIRVEGTLKASALTQYRIEVFANAAGVEHASGYGAGQRYLGFVTVTTDAAGSATFSTDIIAAVLVGETVSATATDASGSTSEFSANRIVVAPLPVLDLDADDSGGETGADFLASYVEDGSPVNIADADAITFDSDTSSLNKLTVTITNLIDGADEILTADTSGTSLNASYVGGVLTITGTANENDYQQVLRSITYHNTSQNAGNTTRILTVTVEDGVFASNVAISRIQILTSNDAPTIQNNGLTIAEGDTVVLTAADLLSTDAEQAAAELTYTVSGVSGGRFEFVATPGVSVTSFTQADINGGAVQFVHDGHEAPPSYDVTVSDGNLSNGPQSVVVTFTNVNEAPAMNSATFSIFENSSMGTSVGFATSTDSDTGDTKNFTIVSGNLNGAFGINAGSGEIVVLNPAALDFETITSFSLSVAVADAAGASSTAIVTINVTNVSDNSITAISDADAANDIVAENSSNGTIVGITALATDADVSDAVSYSLTDNAAGRFAIDSLTGVVTVANSTALDYELVTSHNITVKATSTDGSFSTNTFLIQLTDVNESGVSAISDLNSSANTVAENSSNGTPVGYTAFAADPDSTDLVTFTLDDNAGGRFSIDTVTGIVTVANGLLLDREAAFSHTIVVRATSTDGSIALLSVDISLIDVNEFTISAAADVNAAANTVAELSLQGTLTGITVSASDTDATINTVTYTLDDNAGGRFQIDSNTGIITIANGALLDYESSPNHTVLVRATSADTSSITQAFVISLMDVNDAPPVITPGQQFNVSELASVGAVFGTVAAVDADGVGTLQGWTIASGNDDGIFAIDPSTGALRISSTTLLNFESTANYTLTLSVNDGITTSLQQTVLVRITDGNEAPIFGAVPSPSVDENSPDGTIVGSVTASDVDSGDLLSYVIVGSTPVSPFSIDAATGIIRVTDSRLLDFESSASVTLQVEVTDLSGLATTTSVTISLIDVNEAPSLINLAGAAVQENRGAGTFAGQLSAIDADAGDVFTWALIDDANGTFVVNASSGRIEVATGTVLNYEETASYIIVAEVTDFDGLTHLQTFTITVLDVNDVPVAVADFIPGIQLTAIEVLASGLLLNDTDEDGDVLQTVLVSGTRNGTLVLRADGSLLYSPDGLFSGEDTFIYYVTDGIANSAPVTVRIDVLAAVGGSTSGNPGDSAESSDSITDSSISDSESESTESGESSGEEITVVTMSQFIAAPVRAADRSESTTTAPQPDTEPLSESGSSSVSEDNIAITGELIASVFVSDFFVNTRSERIKAVSAELAQAAVFGGMILDNGFSSALVSLNFFTIDELVQRINEPTISEREELAGKVAVGSAAVVTTSLSVGYVIWILRGGSLLTTFMSAMPAWQAFDPLPVLQSFHKPVEEDDDSLLSIATRKTANGLKKFRKS